MSFLNKDYATYCSSSKNNDKCTVVPYFKALIEWLLEADESNEVGTVDHLDDTDASSEVSMLLEFKRIDVVDFETSGCTESYAAAVRVVADTFYLLFLLVFFHAGKEEF